MLWLLERLLRKVGVSEGSFGSVRDARKILNAEPMLPHTAA